MKTKMILASFFALFFSLSAYTDNQGREDQPLSVPHLKKSVMEAKDVPALLDAEEVPFTTIGCVNWSAYPYKPEAQFRIAHADSLIFIHYRVSEECVAALATDGGAVFKDACCEFFIMPADDGIYYNFETNCIGSLLLEEGIGKGALRSAAPKQVLSLVRRWASLGTQTFSLRQKPTTWELTLIIPVEAFFRHQLTSLSGRTMRANFYKCGNGLCQRHYLSWQPIRTPNPDFHQSAYFGTLMFQP